MTSVPTAFPLLPRARSWWPQLRTAAATKPRFVGLDAARGLAVIGMAIIHSIVIPAWGTAPEALLGIAHGRASVLFATIAGVSLTLLSGGPNRLEGIALLRARMALLGRSIVLLFIAGFLTFFPSGVAVILASYAFWFMLALPALRWRPRTLLIVAALLAATGQLLATALPMWVPAWGQATSPLGNSFIPDLLAVSTYPAFIWMGFVFAGMAIGRCGLANTRALKRFLLAGLALFVTFAAPFVIQDQSPAPLFGSTVSPSAQEEETTCYRPETDQLYRCPMSEYDTTIERLTEEEWWRFSELLDQKAGGKYEIKEIGSFDWAKTIWSFSPHSGSLFEAFSSGGFALAVIAGLILLGRLPWARWALLPLTGIGAMSLTAYSAHIIVLSLLQPNPVEVDQAGIGGWLVLGLMVAGTIWQLIFTSGPLEQVTGAVADRLAGKPAAPTPSEPT